MCIPVGADIKQMDAEARAFDKMLDSGQNIPGFNSPQIKAESVGCRHPLYADYDVPFTGDCSA